MVFMGFMIAAGVVTEVLRGFFLRRRHEMSMEEYYRRKARGEKVPDL